ncbi:MAG TPA: hypothetical protein VGC41_01265, partial [Kofleriaceae bacterium]
DIVVGEPKNIGYGRLYEMLLDEAVIPRGPKLVDASWPVHYVNADRTPAGVYGLHGDEIQILDGRDRAAVAAFEPTTAIRSFAVHRVATQLTEEGEDLYRGQPETDERDPDDFRLEATEKRHGDRVAFMRRELAGEWSRVKTGLLSALDDARSGRCAILQWTGKNPAL